MLELPHVLQMPEVGTAKGASASLIRILYYAVIGLAVYSIYRMEERALWGRSRYLGTALQVSKSLLHLLDVLP